MYLIKIKKPFVMIKVVFEEIFLKDYKKRKIEKLFENHPEGIHYEEYWKDIEPVGREILEDYEW